MNPADQRQIRFEVRSITRAATPSRRTTPRKRPAQHELRCLECGDSGTLTDLRLAGKAATIHSRDAHGGARPVIATVPRLDA